MKKAEYVTWFVWVIALMCPMVAAESVEPTPAYTAIQQAFLREQFDTVTTLAQAFMTQHPDDAQAPRVWLWLALSLDRLGRSPDALDELNRLQGHVEAQDPVWPELLFWEGDISRRAFQMARARSAFRQLLEQYPNSTWSLQAQLGLGFIAMHQQAYESAIGYFHEVALQHPDAPGALDALFLEGFCDLRLKRFNEAVAMFQWLLGRVEEPTVVAQTAFYLGESFTGLKRYEDAIHAYQRALAVAKTSKWGGLSLFGLGWAEYQMGRCEESLDALKRYLKQPETEERRVEAQFSQGSCLLRLGRETEALSVFEQLVSRSPGHPLAFESGLAIADTYWRQNRLVPAKELLHTVLRWNLDALSRAQVQLRLGGIALSQGNTTQAKTIFDLAKQAQEPKVRQAALSGLGDVQMFLGHLTDAAKNYEAAIHLAEQSPQAAWASYQLGRIYLQLGALNEAVGLFERLTSSSDAALAENARLGLVLAYLNQHDEPRARALIESMRRAQPRSVIAARVAYYEALLALDHGEQEAAQRLCQETLTNAPGTDEAIDSQLLLADLRAERSSIAEAMTWLLRTYANPDLPLHHRAKLAKRLADFSRSEQAYAQAIRWYDEAAELLPSMRGEAWYHLASCYEEGGDIELAMRWYQHIDQPPWSVRGQLAVAKLLERQDRPEAAEAIYEQLATTAIPEAGIAQERLTALREAITHHKE